VQNSEFTKTLAHVLRKPALVPAPAFMLKAMLGEGAVLVLEGQRVLPARAREEGYAFKFPQLEGALADLVG
jgi:NAD dependent epimerase/dehydratase family enzyme